MNLISSPKPTWNHEMFLSAVCVIVVTEWTLMWSHEVIKPLMMWLWPSELSLNTLLPLQSRGLYLRGQRKDYSYDYIKILFLPECSIYINYNNLICYFTYTKPWNILRQSWQKLNNLQNLQDIVQWPSSCISLPVEPHELPQLLIQHNFKRSREFFPRLAPPHKPGVSSTMVGSEKITNLLSDRSSMFSCYFSVWESRTSFLSLRNLSRLPNLLRQNVSQRNWCQILVCGVLHPAWSTNLEKK